jgi:putative endonuclease
VGKDDPIPDAQAAFRHRRLIAPDDMLMHGPYGAYNYEDSSTPKEDAIAREKGIKRMLRAQKIALIESMNPQWQDLSEE